MLYVFKVETCIVDTLSTIVPYIGPNIEKYLRSDSKSLFYSKHNNNDIQIARIRIHLNAIKKMLRATNLV